MTASVRGGAPRDVALRASYSTPRDVKARRAIPAAPDCRACRLVPSQRGSGRRAPRGRCAPPPLGRVPTSGISLCRSASRSAPRTPRVVAPSAHHAMPAPTGSGPRSCSSLHGHETSAAGPQRRIRSRQLHKSPDRPAPPRHRRRRRGPLTVSMLRPTMEMLPGDFGGLPRRGERQVRTRRSRILSKRGRPEPDRVQVPRVRNRRAPDHPGQHAGPRPASRRPASRRCRQHPAPPNRALRERRRRSRAGCSSPTPAGRLVNREPNRLP